MIIDIKQALFISRERILARGRGLGAGVSDSDWSDALYSFAIAHVFQTHVQAPKDLARLLVDSGVAAMVGDL